MKTRSDRYPIALPFRSALALAALAGCATCHTFGQSLNVRGLLHSPTGAALVFPDPTGQGVIVRENGGQDDGVSIQLDNTWGASVRVDSSSLLQTDGISRSIRCAFVSSIEPCAGTPEECGITTSLRSTGAGTVLVNVTIPDYAGDIDAIFLDDSGAVVGQQVLPTGGLEVAYLNCPPGSELGHMWRSVWDESQNKWVSILVWGCLGSINVGNPIIPVFRTIQFVPSGPINPGIERGVSRCVVTSTGIPELSVSQAEMAVRTIATTDAPSDIVLAWAEGGGGAGGSILQTTCQSNTQCCEDCDDRDDTSLTISAGPGGGPRVLALASRDWRDQDSDDDGLSDDIEVSFEKKCPQCNGHISLIKQRDSNARVISVTSTSHNPEGTINELAFDFTALGTDVCRMRFYAQDGGEIGPPGGVDLVNGGGFPVRTDRCPPPAQETWQNQGTTGNPVWVFTGCLGGGWSDYALPDGSSVLNVHRCTIEPVGATVPWGRPERFEIQADSDFTVDSFSVRTIPNSPVGCDSLDFNNDGGFFDPTDIEALLSVFSEGPCIPDTATCNDIDFNNDGALFDPCDINSFLVVFSEGPCTPCGL